MVTVPGPAHLILWILHPIGAAVKARGLVSLQMLTVFVFAEAETAAASGFFLACLIPVSLSV